MPVHDLFFLNQNYETISIQCSLQSFHYILLIHTGFADQIVNQRPMEKDKPAKRDAVIP